jgi:hypothetical protein
MTMAALRIRALHARYHLPRPRLAARQRLDRVLRCVVDQALDQALERAGVAPEEEICIRSVQAPVTLPLSATDATLVETWSGALADAIRRAAGPSGAAPDSGVLRYRSRLHLLLDMSAGVAREDLRRAWAWHRLGLWPAAARLSSREAVAALVAAWTRVPASIPLALRELALRGWLAGLARRLDTPSWRALAAAALRVARATLTAADLETALRPRFAPAPGPSPQAAVAAAAAPAALPLAERAWKTSRLAPVLALLELPASAALAVAALLLMEAEPALLGRPRHEALPLLRDLAARLRPGLAVSAPRASGSPIAPAPAGDLPASEADRIAPARRQRALTAQGGVLFVLALLDELALPDRLLDAFPQRPLPWTLHRLALELAPLEAEDPAALAFAGLPPDAPPPSRNQPPPEPGETEALQVLGRRIAGHLRERLLPLYLEEAAVLPFVCARRAEIFADPGWIEARFSLDDVSTDLRRAGLDLDPGYLPWLGVVVRFRYE